MWNSIRNQNFCLCYKLSFGFWSAVSEWCLQFNSVIAGLLETKAVTQKELWFGKGATVEHRLWKYKIDSVGWKCLFYCLLALHVGLTLFLTIPPLTPHTTTSQTERHGKTPSPTRVMAQTTLLRRTLTASGREYAHSGKIINREITCTFKETITKP
jgi:hypothetical protein